MVGYRLVVNDELGERVLREYPAAAATTLEGFIAQLEAATTILVGSADELDLDTLVLRSPVAQPR